MRIRAGFFYRIRRPGKLIGRKRDDAGQRRENHFIIYDGVFPVMLQNMPNVLIRNVRILREGRLENAEILIENGKFVRIAKSCEVSAVDRVIDGHQMAAIPAGIDVHVHFRDPGANYKEDWYSGSCSAACGGITTVLEQPNTVPAVTDRESFIIKRKLAERRSIVDYGINGGVFNNIDRLPELWKEGAVAFGEIFMGLSTGGLSVDQETLEKAFKVIAKLDATATVHAEDDEIRLRNEELLKYDNDPDVHSRIRPNECEATAVKNCLDAYRKAGCRVHICHTSAPESVALLEEERARTKSDEYPLGKPRLTSEVTPHHLFLSTRDCARLGSYVKMNPPVRSPQSAEYMMKALTSGLVNVVASDHAPHRAYEKDVPVKKAPSGIPGVETLMPLMLQAVRRNLISLERVIETTSRNPARIFDLERHGKGMLAVGYDADLILFDPKNVTKIRADRLHTKCEWTPFEGMEAVFPAMTFSRGELIQQDGEIVVSRGRGRFLTGAGYDVRAKNSIVSSDENDDTVEDPKRGTLPDEEDEDETIDDIFDGEEYDMTKRDSERRKA